jgi:hypothetical protein
LAICSVQELRIFTQISAPGGTRALLIYLTKCGDRDCTKKNKKLTPLDGNFSVSLTQKGKSLQNYYVQIRFKLSQHTRDEALMKSFITYFNCGTYYKYPIRPLGDFRCVDFTNNYEKLIPFFKKYPILGIKAENFKD